jgi:hypothetical protein
LDDQDGAQHGLVLVCQFELCSKVLERLFLLLNEM